MVCCIALGCKSRSSLSKPQLKKIADDNNSTQNEDPSSKRKHFYRWALANIILLYYNHFLITFHFNLYLHLLKDFNLYYLNISQFDSIYKKIMILARLWSSKYIMVNIHYGFYKIKAKDLNKYWDNSANTECSFNSY